MFAKGVSKMNIGLAILLLFETFLMAKSEKGTEIFSVNVIICLVFLFVKLFCKLSMLMVKLGH